MILDELQSELWKCENGADMVIAIKRRYEFLAVKQLIVMRKMCGR